MGGDNSNVLIKSASLRALIQNTKSTDSGLPLSEKALKLMLHFPRKKKKLSLERQDCRVLTNSIDIILVYYLLGIQPESKLPFF